ncbi:hypothetical protein LshimejAT787_0602320 [Lyophyllum shimeji]|uniref:Uncharacterized protein n=1 Tax=Lyophyllum shimeji TaxID=47721 RepID=A0A9P3UPJ6_LYOSH|nr:hypothetical protein LshimejAT787_0602320 [Lyophyllum shimeji]
MAIESPLTRRIDHHHDYSTHCAPPSRPPALLFLHATPGGPCSSLPSLIGDVEREGLFLPPLLAASFPGGLLSRHGCTRGHTRGCGLLSRHGLATSVNG